MEEEFLKWFNENEDRFANWQYNEKHIAYSAWQEGRRNAVRKIMVDDLPSIQINDCPVVEYKFEFIPNKSDIYSPQRFIIDYIP